MSMISAQCDELRSMSESVGLAMPQAATLMMEAADTIDRLDAENANLRELVLTLAFCANDEADCDQCPMNGARCDVVQQCFCDGVAEALCELGIEVDV